MAGAAGSLQDRAVDEVEPDRLASRSCGTPMRKWASGPALVSTLECRTMSRWRCSLVFRLLRTVREVRSLVAPSCPAAESDAICRAVWPAAYLLIASCSGFASSLGHCNKNVKASRRWGDHSVLVISLLHQHYLLELRQART